VGIGIGEDTGGVEIRDAWGVTEVNFDPAGYRGVAELYRIRRDRGAYRHPLHYLSRLCLDAVALIRRGGDRPTGSVKIIPVWE